LGLKDFSTKIQNEKSDILILNKPVLVSKGGESIKRGNIVSLRLLKELFGKVKEVIDSIKIFRKFTNN